MTKVSHLQHKKIKIKIQNTPKDRGIHGQEQDTAKLNSKL
jgi:hypothetical protein